MKDMKERSKTPCPFCGELAFVCWDEWQGFQVGHACERTGLTITTRDFGKKKDAMKAWEYGVSTITTRERPSA